MGISVEMPFFFFLDSYKISSRRGAEMKNKDPRWLFHWGSFAYKGAVCCPAYSTRERPVPVTTSPMCQALYLAFLMSARTASALSAETMAVMPMPMLKT